MSQYDALIKSRFDVKSMSGDERVVICPWHDDRSGHLYVNAKLGIYHCKSCGAKGHLRSVMERMPLPTTQDIRERLEELKAPKEDPGGRVYDDSWLNRFDFHHEYWDSRDFSEDVQAMFELGYDPVTDRVTVPLRSLDGRLLGVIQRVLNDDKPKYRYPRGFPIGKHLFGQWLVGDRQKVALVEGSLDAISCWDARVPALALLGSRLTVDQRQALLRLHIRTVAIFTDNDRPGRDAVWQIHEQLTGSGIQVQVCHYRSYWTAKDPGELSPQQRRKAYHSAEPWQQWKASHKQPA